MTTSVLVVGAGPVGLATAIEAVSQGFATTIVDPRRGPIDKACGEGLMPGALAALKRWGIDPPGRPLLGVRYQNARTHVEHRFPGTPGRGVRRLTLHSALEQAAKSRGVEFHEDNVVAVHNRQDGVVVETQSGGTLQADYLLACDGLHSPIARSEGLHATRKTTATSRYGLRQHFAIEPWSDLIGVYYSAIAELYVTPVADDEVGIAILGPRGLSLEEALSSVPDVGRRLDGVPRTSTLRGAGPFPQKTSARTHGRVLLVGDASGYVDAITGEGLRVGFAQAVHAVSALAAKNPKAYEASWRTATREFRVLTHGLSFLATSPLRPLIVPGAKALPAVFGSIVNALAR